MEVAVEKKESLWLQLLESILTQKQEQSGNVFVLGGPQTGKKKVIELMREKYGHFQPIEENKTDIKDLEKVYIMDFLYIKLKKEKEEDVEERGKLNFFIINKKYEFMKQFFSKEMFRNLIVVIVLDLAQPHKIIEEFEAWHSFIYSNIRACLEEVDITQRKKIFQEFQEIIGRMTSLNKGAEKVKLPTVPITQQIHEIQEMEEEGEEEENDRKDSGVKLEEGENKEENKVMIIEEQKQEENNKEKEPGVVNGIDSKKEILPKNDEKQEISQKNDEKEEISLNDFKLPILILGNKADTLDKINDEKTLDYIKYIERKLAVDYNASIINASAFQNINVEVFLNFLYYTILKKEDVDKNLLNQNFNLKSLFVVNGTDQKSILQQQFQNVINYQIPIQENVADKEDQEKETNIDFIQDFFNNIKNGVYNYPDKKEVTYSSRRIELGSTRNIQGGANAQPKDLDRIRSIINKK